MAERASGSWKSVVGPVVWWAAGFVGGAIIGGGLLPRIYDWTTEWTVDAPRAEVFRILNTPDLQQRWWPSMVVERAEQLPGGSDRWAITYRVVQAPSVRRVAPPFIIRSLTSDVERDVRTRAVVTGDLAGVLETLYYDRPDGGTRIVFHWYTRVTNPLLNALGYLMRPVYRASHDHVMREGEAGLRALLAGRVAEGVAVDAKRLRPSDVAGE